ncbi:unnamed protein product [Dibothriocephalus latus]|uniref:Uncharacterized protein n=1 Tax=Dibothriocephalus latus TaxID=60516 RepID=A0A3P6U318_DIBLA|nr:unnamed protein product [Dibothriocephalus latus]
MVRAGLLNREWTLGIEGWTGRALLEPGTQSLTARSLHNNYHVDVFCLSEVGIPDSGTQEIKILGVDSLYPLPPIVNRGEVLANFKILSTAILFRLIIKRPISPLRWTSLFLILIAGIVNGISSLDLKGDSTASVLHITPKGIFMIIIYVTISGLAGVYTEYILKNRVQVSLLLSASPIPRFCSNGVYLEGERVVYHLGLGMAG